MAQRLPIIYPPYFGDPTYVTVLSQSLVSLTTSYLNQLGVAAAALVPPSITPVFPTVTAPPTPITTPLPTFDPITWTTPALPDPFAGTIDISGYMPLPFDQDPPPMTWGTAPAAFSETSPSSPPIDLNLPWPTLSLTLPTAPNLLNLTTITFGGVALPTAPSDDTGALTAVEPSIVPYGPESIYTSSQLTFLQTTLRDRIENGGTGLPAAIEAALWDRAREREYRQMDDATLELERMEAMGFMFPPGVYLDAKVKLQTEMGNAIAGASREIMIKQAELELENVLKALQQLNDLENKLIDYWNNMQNRALEAAKYVTQAGIAIYNAQVEAYKARLDAYRTRAQIYEALIRGELAKVEVYKAELQGEQIKVQMNKTLVEQYQIENQVALSNVEVYKAELSALQIRADIEKTKVEVFGEQIKAYVGRINAYTANVEGYRAAVQAEATKQEAYKAQVQAYTAEVEAGSKYAEAKIAEFKAKIEAKQIEYDAYRSTIQGETERTRAIANKNATLADAYKAETGAISDYNRVLTEQWRAVTDQNARVAEIGIQAAKMNAELYMSQRSILLDAAKVGAQVAAQLGAAALNAIHFNNSASWSYSGSMANSDSTSDSTSKSDNTNRNLSV